MMGKYRMRFQDSMPLTKKNVTSFTIGIVLFYIIKGSPIDLLSYMRMSMYMVQMAILSKQWRHP